MAAEGPVERDPEPAFDLRVLPASYGLMRAEQALQLEITSRLPFESEAIAELVAIDETQMTRVQVPLGAVAPDATTALSLPVRRLPTPQRALRVAGALSVFVRLRLPGDGGAIADADGPELISYHPEGGGLRVYDAETRRLDFNGGALDPAVAASLPQGKVVAASYSGPTMPLDWRPTPVEESGPDPDHALLGVAP